MKKNLFILLSLLMLALCFSGCNTIQTSSNGDKEPEQTVTPPTSSETAAQTLRRGYCYRTDRGQPEVY